MLRKYTTNEILLPIFFLNRLTIYEKYVKLKNMQIIPRNVLNYITPNGREPFLQWVAEIHDKKVKLIIAKRISRLRQGHLGDYRRLDSNLYELRIHYGPGYRIYFGIFRNNIVILICGGTKRTQPQDITRAQNYWNEFRSNADEHGIYS